jgi:selenocysteine lyase/cysteine desulfurase
MQRRSLLTLPAAAALAQTSTPAGDPPWPSLRAAFPLRPQLIYVNAANVCPAPAEVLAAHDRFLRDFEADPSFQNRAKFGPLREASRAAAAQFLGASAEEIAFTRNTSEATNIIVHGLDLGPGDEVVIVADNHPSNHASWKNQALRRKFQVVEVEASQLVSGPEELLGKIKRAFTPRTRLVAITHVTSTTGLLYPAAEIAAEARKRNIWIHLDGAQSAGMIEVNLSRTGCDSYATSSHKWLMGPLEAGILYVASHQQKRVWPSIVSVGYSGESARGARGLEAFGQRDDAKLAAFAQTFAFLNSLGMAKVEQHIRALTTRLMNQLADQPGIHLRTNRNPALSAGVVKVDLPKVADLNALDAKLFREQGMAFSVTPSGPMRGMRVSPHVYNTIAEMDQIAEAFRKA